jgi:hypothetical protein
VLGLLLTLSACSLPDINVERKAKRATAAGAGFFGKTDSKAFQDRHSGDNSYLATVHVRFTELHMQPVTFDVRKDKRDLVSFNMYESQHTSTYVHLGYSHSDGGIAGLRFSWRF